MSGAPRFDAAVPDGGYAWWYVDALSDDGGRGLTVIAFIGSVFSPYYAWARRSARGRGTAPPPAAQHATVNVALYGGDGRRWTMTERGAGDLQRSETRLAIGPSHLEWDGRALTISIDETTAPWPARVHGSVRVTPAALHAESFALDAAGRHRWTPIAPCAHVEVDLERPRSRWRGPAYLDSNQGSRPLEDDFRRWHWSRARSADGGTEVFYDVERRDGGEQGLALRFDPRRPVAERLTAPPLARLPATAWGIARTTRSDAGSEARVARSLENGPFYARSVIESRLFGAPASAIHESLDMDRFQRLWVQAMLPFRMPRRAR